MGDASTSERVDLDPKHNDASKRYDRASGVHCAMRKIADSAGRSSATPRMCRSTVCCRDRSVSSRGIAAAEERPRIFSPS